MKCLPFLTILFLVSCATPDIPTNPYALAVRKTVADHLEEVRACYKSSSASGTLRISWEINDHGQVSKFRTTQDEVKDPKLLNCIFGKMAHWVFPASPTGEVAVAEYPFMFGKAD